MMHPSITIEVQQNGERPRVYQFDQTQLRLGSSPTCHLRLDSPSPDNREILLCNSGPGGFSWDATQAAPEWLLNGQPCPGRSRARSGDTLRLGQMRVTVQKLVGGGPEGHTPAESGAGGSLEVDHATQVLEEPLGSETRMLESLSPMAGPPQGEEQPAAQSGVSGSHHSLNSYLYLFFAPVVEYLKDDDVSEIMINGPRNIYVEKRGKIVRVPCEFVSEQALQAAVMNVARSIGRFFNAQNARLDARLPDGSRVHAVLSPIARAGTTVAIRKFSREKLTIEKLIGFNSISQDGAALLDAIVKLGKNLLVSGATSSGKTSVLNVLSSMIPPDSRILVLEDASELQLQQSHVVAFETRKPDEHGKGEITIRHLLHSTLRLRPDRIVVGEIRGEESLDLIQAMNTGHDGSMSTIHASSPQGALARLETCALLGAVEVPQSALRQQVASAVQVVIQTDRLSDGSRKITSICEVLGLANGEYRLEPILEFQETGMEPAPENRILGRHVFTGYKPSFLKAASQRGIKLACLHPGWR